MGGGGIPSLNSGEKKMVEEILLSLLNSEGERAEESQDKGGLPFLYSNITRMFNDCKLF